MKATLTDDFRYSADGVNVQTYPAGAELEGAAADSAVAQGKAKPVREASAKKEAPENKAATPAENKTGE